MLHRSVNSAGMDAIEFGYGFINRVEEQLCEEIKEGIVCRYKWSGLVSPQLGRETKNKKSFYSFLVLLCLSSRMKGLLCTPHNCWYGG